MSFLSKFSVKNPVAIVILVLLVTFGGLYSATQFKQESMPDISIPYLFVTALYPGATPQEAQNEVALPLERALKNVEGIEVLESTSANNVATVSLQFSFSADMEEKASKVEEALNGVQLPPEVQRPQISKISFDSGPMMYTSITAKEGTSTEELQNFVRNRIVPSLQGLDGVGKVQSLGLQSEHVFVKLDPDKMAEKGIAFHQVGQVFQAMNLSLPVGEATLDKIKQPVLVTGRVKTLEELKNLVIHPIPEVKLQDIAEVVKGSEIPETITRVQGKPSIALNIVKNGDANTVDVSDLVMEQLESLVQDNGKVKLSVIYDTANDIKKSVNGMVREGLLGALFASILILFFLRNFRATFIAIISIPLSIFAAMSLLNYFTDVTLNIMTLGGMAVAVGRVVDDSIVVIENIVRRMQGQKVTKELILDATKEVANAIISSTLTTVAVFAPLGLLSGIIGKIFAPFALTVVFSLLASLFVAVTVVPMLAYVLMRRSTPKDHGESKLSRKYKGLLNWSLNHKAVIILLGIFIFASSLFLVPLAGFTFIPEQEEKYIIMNMNMPPGTDVIAVDEIVQDIDQKLRDTGNVILSQVTSGGVKGEFDPMTFTAGRSNKATWIVSLTSTTDVKQFIKDKKEQLKPDIEGTTLDIQELSGGPGGSGIYIVVTGNSKADIRIATEKITEAVQKLKGTDSVRNSIREETKSVEIQIRPGDALKYGLSTFQASGLLRPLLSEQQIGKLGDGNRTDAIYLSMEGVTTTNLTDIENLAVPSPIGQLIKVKDIADVKQISQQSALQLRNGLDYATITGNITDKNAAKVNTELKKTLDELSLPEGVDTVLDGSNKQIQDMMQDMGLAMLIAIGMVYVVMVVAFGEGKAPFAILFSLPFAVIGALLGTIIAGEPISIASLIGMLMLIGIVVTNAIVLVDRVQQQVHKGHTIRESLLEAGGTRLRPIIMTAVATICALLPLVLGLGEGGALISKGLAVVVIGGLVTSTLLTLIIVPVMYEVFHYRKAAKERRDEKANGAAY